MHLDHKRIVAWVIAVTLAIGAVLGAGFWLLGSGQRSERDDAALGMRPTDRSPSSRPDVATERAQSPDQASRFIPPTARLPTSTAVAAPPDLEDEGPLAFDPELRSAVLDQIRVRKQIEYAGLHKPWLDAQPASVDPVALTELLVDHDVWVADQMMPGDGLFRPSEAERRFERIAEQRMRLIETIAETFGEDVADSYAAAFPGPEPGQFSFTSDTMPPEEPTPPGFVPPEVGWPGQ